MGDEIRVVVNRFVPGSPADRATGLVGFVSVTVEAPLTVDGIVVRRKLDGELALAFPTRKDWWGIVHPVVRPTDDDGRRAITAAVLAALGMAAGRAMPGGGQQGESAP